MLLGFGNLCSQIRVNKEGAIIKAMGITSKIKFQNLLIPVFCIINILLIVYTTWDKYRKSSCAICHYVPYLSITEKTLAILAIISIISFLIIYYLSHKSKIMAYLSLFSGAFFVGFSIFLQISRYDLYKAFCINCVITTIVYCLIFVILLYEFIFQTVWGNQS